MMFRKFVKALLLVVAGLIGLLILGLLISLIFYPTEYVYRILAWGESDVGDYRENFPSRPMEAAPDPFYFEEALDEERVASVFEDILDIEDLDTFLEENSTQAFIVIQDDAILYENYFNDTQRETMVTSFSVAKSFVTALIGIALAEGYIDSVDDPITDYLPELSQRDPRFKDITIRHLMTMSGGVGFEEMRAILNGDDPLTTYYPDQRKAALEFTDIVDPPGEYFLYNKYYPQLLGMIIERSTGMSVSEFMQEKLWQPMGAEFEASWSLDSEESGFEKMEAGLNARAIDFAKFGRLYLNHGNWNGEQVIPADWVADSTQVDQATLNDSYYANEMGQVLKNDLQGYYKYMWYGFFQGNGYDFAAEGDHGQFIYVSPDKNLIIVRNGYEYGPEMGWAAWISLVHQFAGEF
jgi:CubicO group peptidase (beta-lactamase class C family)